MSYRRGISLFVVLSAASLAGVFALTSPWRELGSVSGRLHPGFLLLAVVGVPLADWVVSGLRLYLFVRAVAPGVSYRACVRNCAVGAFMCAATPSQTGGGPAQVYALTREGATAGQALGALLMTFPSTLAYFAVTSAALWGACLAGLVPWFTEVWILPVAAALYGVLAVAGGLSLACPDLAEGAMGRMLGHAERLGLPAGWAASAARAVHDSASTLRELARRHWRRFLVSLPLAALILGNRHLAGYLAARALGLDPPLAQVLVIQFVICALTYFVPTPGSSGGAEVGSAVWMSALVPQALLGVHTLIWRTATAYLSVAVGGLLFLRYVQRHVAASTPGELPAPAP